MGQGIGLWHLCLLRVKQVPPGKKHACSVLLKLRICFLSDHRLSPGLSCASCAVALPAFSHPHGFLRAPTGCANGRRRPPQRASGSHPPDRLCTRGASRTRGPALWFALETGSHIPFHSGSIESKPVVDWQSSTPGRVGTLGLVQSSTGL